jgi:enoyl-CoA hydratase
LIGDYPRELKRRELRRLELRMPDDPPILRETLAAAAVVVLTLNRPEALNALSDRVMAALGDELTAIESDESVRCVVLLGAGRAFAAGADVNEMSLLEDGTATSAVEGYLDRWQRVRRFEKPLIAGVQGFCLGGGLELALGCDIVVAADDARFGLPEVSLGLIPGAGGTQLTPRAIGKSLAMEMILAGRVLSADEALAHGLCSRVVAREALRDEAIALARVIAGRPPVALRLAKRAVADAFETTLEEGARRELDAFVRVSGTDDAREGMRAFVEKRPPVWSGR